MTQRDYDPARDLACGSWREAYGWARLRAVQTSLRQSVRRATRDEMGSAAGPPLGKPWMVRRVAEEIR